MDFLKVNYESQKTILASFDTIADKFSKDIQLKVNDEYYRIVDFEFYTYSEKLPDPHTYKNDLQLQSNKLYLHGSGIDITFGDGKNYGGILIRSVVKLYGGSDPKSGFMKKQYDGPQKVATELFSNFNLLNGKGVNTIQFLDIEGHNQDCSFVPGMSMLKTSRFGLTPKANDPLGFYLNLKLRYVILLKAFPNFSQTIKDKETVVKRMLKNGELDIEQANLILGYTMKLV
ncbi:hypothetical protein ADIARSV_0409 [Arcticibacter svalbardensis MN12-7]|uniref:Uncharacterized protein n=1 Tax=Arcticibacter svalbardensis MN12-7 TaxID=1150600 RepID=R9H5F5_9SPHI|nr:hypothetical protein [Arcticibacter svalbardensis]EOR96409.1 hypothetical protein ADIARSV_0409 [Arcticibacter svalbardensis MN12-7]